MESVGGWSDEGEIGQVEVGTEHGDGCRLWSVDGLSCRSEDTSEKPSKIC